MTNDGGTRESIESFLEYCRAFIRNDNGERKLYDENVAIEAIKSIPEIGEFATVPWSLLIHGDAKLDQPDWICTDGSGNIVIGFEVTELALDVLHYANAKLRELNNKGNFKRKNSSMAEDLATAARKLVEDNEFSSTIQQLYAKITPSLLTEATIRRIDNKKSRKYHQNLSYPIHLIVHEANVPYYVVDGTREEALRAVGEHDRGNFAMVWHVDKSLNVTRLAAADEFYTFHGSKVRRRERIYVRQP